MLVFIDALSYRLMLWRAEGTDQGWAAKRHDSGADGKLRIDAIRARLCSRRQ